MKISTKKITSFIIKTLTSGITIQDFQTQERMNNPVEKCIMCGTDTEYHFNDHIDYRYGYVEGAGQCCKECYEKV